jgi:sigma-B regulation protein RsbU (phosphoserine phosphatase)
LGEGDFEARAEIETGGDYYDFISFDEIEPGEISIVLGDVTGHGIGAALLMASGRSTLRNNARLFAYALFKILFEFNNQLTIDTDPDKFIILFFGVIDVSTCSIIWASGGHYPALLIYFQTVFKGKSNLEDYSSYY